MKGTSGVQCKFGLSCTRTDCWFQHPPGHSVENAEPIPCRFGLECYRPDCRYSHPAGHVAQAVLVQCRYGSARVALLQNEIVPKKFSIPKKVSIMKTRHETSPPKLRLVQVSHGTFSKVFHCDLEHAQMFFHNENLHAWPREGIECRNPSCMFAHPPRKENLFEDGEGCSNNSDTDRICVWFQKGKCWNGEACGFRHVKQERDGNVIVVRNLSRTASPQELHAQLLEHFKQFGYVCRIQVKTDLDNRSRGFAFVILPNVQCVDEAMQSQHAVWDIKRKVDLPIYIEGDARPARKTTVAQRVDTPPRLPFKAADRVLLVGEGNFSFTKAVVSLGNLSPARAVATSKEQPRQLETLRLLAERGVCCQVDVDATDLSGAGL